MGIPMRATINTRVANERLAQIVGMFEPAVITDLLNYVANRLGLLAVEIARLEYPPPQRARGTAPSPLRTARQWRWWWGMMNRLADGKSVPESLHGWKAVRGVINGHQTLILSGSYFRTGTMIRSIDYRIASTAAGRDIQVGPGPAAGYARYVIGRPTDTPAQARYHQGNWEPLIDLLIDREREFNVVTNRAVAEWLARELKRRNL